MVYKCILLFNISIEHIASNCLFEAIHINSSKCKLFRGVFMIIKAFKMKIYDGMADEYQKRHNELWPEMKEMIHNYGGSNYSILIYYLDISNLKMRNCGIKAETQKFVVNGGILWRILWKLI